MENRVYWVWLSGVPGVGPVVFRTLIETLESPEGVHQASEVAIRDALARLRPTHPRVPELIEKAKARLDEAAEALERYETLGSRLGGKLLTWEDADYPTTLRAQPKVAPPVLFIRGDTTVARQESIAIVGTRNPSPYAAQFAHDLARGASRAGWTVVSGLAKGIDAQAHRGALAVGGPTIAVLGCGVDRIYPSENREIFEAILRTGLIVSQFPYGERPKPENLRKRNQLIAGLAMGLVMAEGGLASGAMIAVRFAEEQRKPVFTFSPEDPSSDKAEGPMSLLGSGRARGIQSAIDGIALLGQLRDGSLGSPAGVVREGTKSCAGNFMDKHIRNLRRSWQSYLPFSGAEGKNIGGNVSPRNLLERLRKLAGAKLLSTDPERLEMLLAELSTLKGAASEKQQTRVFSRVNALAKELGDHLAARQARAWQRLVGFECRAIVFDLDGVLVDSTKLYLEAYRNLLKTQGMQTKPATSLDHLIGLSPRRALSLLWPDDAKARETLRSFESFVAQHASKKLKVFPGIPEFLDECARRRVKLGVATSENRVRMDLFLGTLPSRACLQACISWGDTVRHKPFPDPIVAALERLGVAPKHAVYVGDKTSDVEAGRASKTVNVLALWGAHDPLDELLLANPDVVVTDPEELRRFLSI